MGTPPTVIVGACHKTRRKGIKANKATQLRTKRWKIERH